MLLTARSVHDKRLNLGDTVPLPKRKCPGTVNEVEGPGGRERPLSPNSHRKAGEPVAGINPEAFDQNIPTLLPGHGRHPDAEHDEPRILVETAKVPIHTYTRKRSNTGTFKMTSSVEETTDEVLSASRQLTRQNSKESHCKKESSSPRKQFESVMENKLVEASRDCQRTHKSDDKMVQRSRRKRRLPLNELPLVRSPIQYGSSQDEDTNRKPEETRSGQDRGMHPVNHTHISTIATITRSRTPRREPVIEAASRNHKTVRRPLTAIRNNLKVRKHPNKLPIDIRAFRVPPKIQPSAAQRASRIRLGSGFDDCKPEQALPPSKTGVIGLKLEPSGGLPEAKRASNLATTSPVRNPVNGAEVQLAMTVQSGSYHGVEQMDSPVCINSPNSSSRSHEVLGTTTMGVYP
ncbi:MAG: hypothetical protein M1836_006262 [Candelina mexicana]|nr:MAG: hypothetical protein M1836_006262 [Candelina mexicana]